MSIVAVAPRSGLRRMPVSQAGDRRRPLTRPISLSMKEGPTTTSEGWKQEATPRVAEPRISSAPSDLRFDRLQPSDKDCDCRHRRAFGRFIAREALVDEEYWTAAWLRAESHWEDRPHVRHVDNFKRQFAEQEFVAIKRRCNRQNAERSICIIAVKREERNVRRTILSSIVGTLDISIRHLICGETFPGERVKASIFSCVYKTDQPRYGYVANLCVAKYARRQGIASNMLWLAVEAAKSYGADQLFVHVHKDNKAAWKLYDKIGFQMVEMALPHSSEEQNHLLCLKLSSSSAFPSCIKEIRFP